MRSKLRLQALEARDVPVASLVADINPDPVSTVLESFTQVGSTIYFVADDGTNGVELWKTDGTAAGTALVADINPGLTSSYPSELVAVGGTLYFRANDGVYGYEIWKTDGTPTGTVMVADLYPGATGSYPSDLRSFNGSLFFAANDDVVGVELWRSNGTAGSTSVVSDLYPGSLGSGPQSLTVVGSTLYFVAAADANGTELWKTDGSEAGTEIVANIAPAGSSFPSQLTNANGTLFFTADNQTNGAELWKSDGTALGTVLVADINPGGADSLIQYMTAVGGRVYFSAIDGTNGRELWTSDGTGPGTVLLGDLATGIDDSTPREMTAIGSTVYFTAATDLGRELWKTDGTPTGTTLVSDLYPGSYSGLPGSLTAVGERLYFWASDASSAYELWRSDGSAAGTIKISDGLSITGKLHRNGSTLFFNNFDVNTGSDLWRFDISPAPTVTINQASGQADPTNGTSINFDVVFSSPVTGFSAADVVLSGTAGGPLDAQVSGTGTNYTVTVTGMSSSGTVIASIPAGAAIDSTSTPNDPSTSTDNTVTFDNSAPSVTLEKAAGQAELTSISPIVFDLVFTEPPQGFTNADVSFAGSTVGGTLVASLTQNTPTTYTLSVTGMTGQGEVVASIPAGSYTDAVGNPGAASTSTDPSVTYSNPSGTIAFTQAIVSAVEGVGTVTITVTRTGGASGAVSVQYETLTTGSAAFGGASASGLDDYVPTSGTLNWGDTETGPKTFTITINEDVWNEGAESIDLRLFNVQGGADLGTISTSDVVIAASDPMPIGSFVDDDTDGGRLTLTGGGTAVFYLNDPDGNGRGDVDLIELTGTNPATSVLTLIVTKPATSTGVDAGIISIGGVTGPGLRTLSASKSNLTGSGINFTGRLGSLTIRDILNGADIIAGAGTATQTTSIFAQSIANGTTIDVDTRLTSLSALEIGVGAIDAPSIGSITTRGRKLPLPAITGNFGSTVTVAGTGLAANAIALSSMSVAGSVLPGANIVSPSIGTITVKGNMAGNVTASGAGITPLPTRNVLRSVNVTGSLSSVINVNGPVGSIAALDYLTGSVTVSNIGSITTRGRTLAPTNPGNLGADITVTGNGLPQDRVAMTTLSVAGDLLASADIAVQSATSITVRRNLLGDINVSGTNISVGRPMIGTLFVGGAISGSTITVPGLINIVTAGAFQTGAINAGGIGTVTIQGNKALNVLGNLHGDITLSGVGILPTRNVLGTLRVAAGSIDGSDISVTGNIGLITAQRIRDSRIFAGYTGAVNGTGTFGSVGTINSLTTTGLTGSFENSHIIGKALGTMTVRSIVVDNPIKFGFLADTTIRLVRSTTPAFIYNLTSQSPQGIDDFEVRIVD